MSKKLLSAIFGTLTALIIGALIILAQGYNPLTTYAALFQFSLLGSYPIDTTLKNAVPLVLTGLSASVAFASGPINLGQPGQLIAGALFATLGGLYLDLPPFLMVPALIFLALSGGALWAGLAAVLRILFNMSEFIVTLMLNFVADYFTAWVIAFPLLDPKAFSPMTAPIASSAWLPDLGGLSSTVIVMLLAAAAIWFVYQRWTAGYEWRISGQNSLFARLGGCNIDRNFVAVMLVTGALAGLAGGLVVMGGPHRFIKGLGANYAWDGIMIAIVANNGILASLFYGLFFSAIQTGALGMELITAVPSEISEVLQAVLVLVIVASRESLNAFFDRREARVQAHTHGRAPERERVV
jgi:general nucleoside transport system permease protein